MHKADGSISLWKSLVQITCIAQLVRPLSQYTTSLGTPCHQTSFATSALFPLCSVPVTTPPFQNNVHCQTKSTLCTNKALHAVSIVLSDSKLR